MHSGVLPNGEPQDLYFPEDHTDMPGFFKGMKKILEERGFTEEADLNSECLWFKCAEPMAGCCFQCMVFNQPDFKAQKPALFELVESHGHIAFFYPKCHCELNFIEQCWGAAKCQYRILPLTLNEVQMEKDVRACLDGVDLIKMRR